MSVHVMSWAWGQTVGSVGTKLVLLKLADNANDKGIAWPHQETIARECEVDVRTVQRAVAELKNLGLVEVKRDSSRPGSPNVYRFPVNSRHSVGTPVADVGTVDDTVSGLIDKEPSFEPKEPTSSRVSQTRCPQCGVKVKGKTVAEHLADVHLVDVVELAAKSLSATERAEASQS